MSDFNQKQEAAASSHHFEISPTYLQQANQHVEVKTKSGAVIHLKPSQIPVLNIYRNNNLSWRYNSNGDLSTALANGDQILLQIDRGSGSGPASGGEIWLRETIANNTGADVQMVDSYSRISEILFQTPSGQEIQRFSGQELRSLAVRFYDKDQWRRICNSVGSNENYGKGTVLTNQIQDSEKNE